jgi:pantothenate kinase
MHGRHVIVYDLAVSPVITETAFRYAEQNMVEKIHYLGMYHAPYVATKPSASHGIIGQATIR